MAASKEALRLGLENAINETKRLEAEREYLLRWLGGFSAELRGLSADALSLYALTGAVPLDYPRDTGDLGRCDQAFTAMPRHLQERAHPLLEQWREQVAEKERSRGR